MSMGACGLQGICDCCTQQEAETLTVTKIGYMSAFQLA